MASIEGIFGGSSGSLQTLDTSATGKDDFLKMMIAQLQNQDPLNPLDGTDFTAQLAQFSSLEQLSNMNTQLETLGLYQSSLNNSQSVSFIGREITARGDVIKADGSSVEFAYNLSESADVKVGIYDENGTLVDTLNLGIQPGGDNSVAWDSSKVAAGNYSFDVSANDVNGNAVSAYTMITGKVNGVSFEQGAPYLFVNEQKISFENVISVNESI